MAQEHPIRVVALRTGLSPHVIRIWEKRYGAVVPRRTPTNRRFYTDEDIERLTLLRRATLSGRSIGQLAHLSLRELQELVKSDELLAAAGPHPVLAAGEESLGAHLDAAMSAMESLEPKALEVALSRAAAALSQPVFLEQFLVQLMDRVGECWRSGSLRVMHEHMVSSVLRTFLGNMGSGYPMSGYAPALIATTLAGQLHELGALAAAATAVSEGWRVTYLGPNLPAEEIAAAARVRQCKVVLISILHPADDARIIQELYKLRNSLEPDVSIVVGGRATGGYSQALADIRAVQLSDLAALRRYLESLRQQPTL